MTVSAGGNMGEERSPVPPTTRGTGVDVAPCEAYLDYAAATPLDPRVLEAMLPYLTERFHNPSSPYAAARRVRADVEDARRRLALVLGARADGITLTSGATEANNLAFAATDGHVVTDAIEHQSVLRVAEGRPHTLVGVAADGRVDAHAMAAAITSQTELVSLELANGEVGCVQPVRELARLVAAERRRRLEAGEPRQLLLHVDASQATGQLAVNVSSLEADMVTVSAAKIYGPKQVGLLWCSDRVRLRPLVLGGGQERGVRSGTENVAGIVGFARALELAEALRREEEARLRGLRQGMEAELRRELPWCVVSGPRQERLRLPGLLHLSLPGLEAQRLVVLLEREGVSVGTGSACAASKMRASHVLEALGMPPTLSQGSLRLTLGRPSTPEEVAYGTRAIVRCARSEMVRLGLDDAAMSERAAALGAAGGRWRGGRG
ncbi:cysteine desulfurase family protein [Olsenella phocaeensis]|uniref:cysteine desulfurase family protein n=1 Tax=Olsenella phocaeensis TaxID=1852385 RepID=UPI003A928027